MSGEKAKEKSFITRVVSTHRVTIPLIICRLLDIEDGDIVRVTVKKEAS
jgi:bifunctional DNA-binding transcriptional regulator/antitoxin component of YhaV-PrlF toxin-antitoxin module